MLDVCRYLVCKNHRNSIETELKREREREIERGIDREIESVCVREKDKKQETRPNMAAASSGMVPPPYYSSLVSHLCISLVHFMAAASSEMMPPPY
jgi:hypothetical protein